MNKLLLLLFLLVPVTVLGQIDGSQIRYRINAQTGTTYTVSNNDRGKLVTFNNAGSVTVTLPQAGLSGAFPSGWYISLSNIGAGTVTINHSVSTIDGSASAFQLTTGQSISLHSTGTNYVTSGKGTGASNGYTPGGTDVAVADGGTGSSTASAARAAPGLVIGTDIEAHDADLTTIAGLSPSNDDFLQRKSGAWANRTVAQVKSDLGVSNVDNTSDATKNAANATLINKTVDGDDNTVQDLPYSAIKSTSRSGTGNKVATVTGTLTNGRCVEIDASGNLVQSAAGCSSGAGDMLLGTSQTVTALKGFNDGTLKLVGGDYGASDASLPGSPVTGTFYRNTNASSNRIFFYDGVAYREVFLSGTSGPVSLAQGGTGVALSDPNADRLMFWDDSAGAVAFLTAGSGLNISGTTITATAAVNNAYDLLFDYNGVPAASSTFRTVAPRSFDLASSFTGTVCSAGTAATAQTDFLVKVNNVTKATLRFAALGTTCSIVGGTTTSVVATDVITVIAPASPDATLANVAIAIKGTMPEVPYDLFFNYDGVPAASTTFRTVVARDFNSGTNWTGTVCSAATAATAQSDFLIKKNGSTVGTLRFAAAATTCTIVSPTTSSFTSGDVITLVAPASPDATLAGIAITLKATLP